MLVSDDQVSDKQMDAVSSEDFIGGAEIKIENAGDEVIGSAEDDE